MQILDKSAYLLTTCDNGGEWVQQYTESEMVSLFAEAEMEQLGKGRPVIHFQRDGSGLRYVDMIAAGRLIQE